MVGDSFDDQVDMAQRNFDVEIFAYKVGATQIRSVLAPCTKHSIVLSWKYVIIQLHWSIS